MQALVDADVMIRFLTGDDPGKQVAARRLFDRAERGELVLSTPATTIADCVHVLRSPRLYGLPREEIASRLVRPIQVIDLQVPNRRDVLRALDLFGTTNLDSTDATIVPSVESSGDRIVFSYDRDFDRFPGIDRREP